MGWALETWFRAGAGDVGRIGSQRIPLTPSVLAARPGLRRYTDQPVVVGIRPEDLPAANGSDPVPVLQGDVELVEALGSEQLVHFRTDARMIRSEALDSGDGAPGTELSTDANVARVDPRHGVSTGERISFALASERIEFFDPQTGLAIWD